MRLLRLTFLLLLAAATAAAQPHLDPYLVKDLNTTVPDFVSLRPLAAADSYLFLSGSTSDTGIEPWRTDGTAAGTSLLRDIFPGGNGYPQPLGRLGDTILFSAIDPIHGFELWRTDGTPAGTRLVADIHPGPGGSINGGSIVFHGKVLFSATTGQGQQIWSTDGTREGTVPVVVMPFTAGATLSEFKIVDDRIVFGTFDGLWVTDGTTAGTRHVGSDLTRNAENITVVGRRVFFTAAFGLWSTDLATEPVPATPEYYQGVIGRPIAIGNGVVYFRGTAGAGYEPWLSVGGFDGAMMLRDINPSGSSIEDGYAAAAGGFVFFPANDGIHGRELWRTDGTPAGTVLVKDINPGSGDGLDRGGSLRAAFGRVWFVANDGHERGLWTSDGTDAGTRKLAAAGLNSDLVEFRGKVHFNGDATSKATLWASDGTPEGTAATEPLVAIQTSSNPQGLVAFGQRVFFSATDVLNSPHYYTSDGTAEGTRRFDDLPFGVNPLSYRGSLYLARDRALYRVDDGGAPVLIAQFPATISTLSVRAGLLYITAASATYVSDGTPGGTAAATGVIPWADATDVLGHPMHLDTTGLQEASPGAPVRTIKPFSGYATVSRLFDAGGIQLFLRQTTGKVEVWRSDGSTEGTFVVATIAGTPFALSYDRPFTAAAAGRVLYVSIDDGAHGFELWRSDGTAAGTFLLKDIAPGAAGSLPSDLTPLDDHLYFTAEDEHSVRRLWATDGTSAGTRVVAELGDRANVANLIAANGLLFFSADDGTHGNELWVTDGTTSGTHLYDVEPGTGASTPQRLTAAADKLFFTARTAANGRELWALPLTGQTISIGDVRAGRDAALATLTVSLGTPATAEVTADWTTVDNVARAGTDYEAASGRLVFAPGEQQKTLSVALIPNDGFGGNRPLNVRLFLVRGAAPVKSLGTILIEQRLAADLEVTLALATGPNADAGDRAVTIRNLGPSSAVDVQLIVRRDPPGNDSVRVPEIAAGASFTKVVSAASLIGAYASCSLPDPNPANNTASTTRIAAGPFGLALSIEPGTISAGQHATLLVVHRGEPPGPKEVTLTSSNPAVLAVPASVTVDADHPVSLDVVAAGGGAVDLSATDGYALVVLHLDVAAAGTRPRWPSSLVLIAPGTAYVGVPAMFDTYVMYAAPDTGAIATGTVTFSIDGRPFMAVPMEGGRAFVTTDAIPRAAYTVTATYGGDANFLPSSASADLLVLRGYGVRSFTGSARRIDAANAEIHLEVVGGAAAVPAGTVTIAAYQSGPPILKNVPLVHGTMSAIVHQQGRPLTLFVTYSGDENYLPFSSSVTFTPEHVRAAR